MEKNLIVCLDRTPVVLPAIEEDSVGWILDDQHYIYDLSYLCPVLWSFFILCFAPSCVSPFVKAPKFHLQLLLENFLPFI